ncbi:hypothetical protein EX30DRAFT_369609 [Ascodesmis nigricans]|uniref:BBC1/AIM3 cysteine proteinase-fold domain-containing protein n=1 Tax=Ascodesmis nigricans TaxID=341454 RepID=A0A4S2N536_9PEZI|nr:hypothetical protein EX30DRAFT_369609 [Ascodesmis nigricans]
MDRLKGLREKLPSRDSITSSSSRSRSSTASESRFSVSSFDSVKSFIPGRSESREPVVARPISSLPDVSHFGPPPKRNPNLLPPPPPSRPRADTSPASVSRNGTVEPAPRPARPTLPTRVTPPLPARARTVDEQPPPPPPRPGLSQPALIPATNTQVAGTSWAEKRHALETVNRFQKNPTAVSVGDLKSTATTARSFQARHGEQIAAASGPARSFRDRFDGQRNIGEDESRSSGNAVAGVASSLFPRGKPLPPPLPSPSLSRPRDRSSTLPTPPETPPLPTRRSSSISVVKKKPPPPPPPKSRKPPLLPPPRSPKAPSSKESSRTPKYPINRPNTIYGLANCGLPETFIDYVPNPLVFPNKDTWYTVHPLVLPEPYRDMACSKHWQHTLYYNYRGRGDMHRLEINLLWTYNFSLTRIRVDWLADNPLSVKIEQKWFQAPMIPVGPPQPIVADWCQNKFLASVGNGECWTLARDALHELPGLMRTQGHTHGACIYSSFYTDEYMETLGLGLKIIARGDVIQFWKAKWIDGLQAGSPDHTAVITNVLDTGIGNVEVLEQNVSGCKFVMPGQYCLRRGLIDGGVRVFRPVADIYGFYSGKWADKHHGMDPVGGNVWEAVNGDGVLIKKA